MFRLIFAVLAIPFRIFAFVLRIFGAIFRTTTGRVNLKIKRGDHTIDARPYFEGAFIALPYVNPKYKERLADAFRRHWDDGTIERAMIKTGLPDDFFVNLHGKRPEEAIKAIASRVTMSIYRVGRAMDEAAARKSGYFPFSMAQCDVNLGHCCEQARTLQGKIVTLKGRTEFPLRGCTAEACACQWMLIRDKGKR